jgi:hypothetical protein
MHGCRERPQLADVADRQQLALVEVEGLVHGLVKDSHVGGKLQHRRRVERAEERLRIVGKLDAVDDLPRQDLYPNCCALLQPAHQGPGNKQVQGWGQRAPLPHSRLPQVLGRDVTIDNGGCHSLCEDGTNPSEEARARAHRLHDSEEEVAVDSVIGFPDVKEP